MCLICIVDGRINVPALQHCCSWRWPWVLGSAPHYMLVADYAAGMMVAGGCQSGRESTAAGIANSCFSGLG